MRVFYCFHIPINSETEARNLSELLFLLALIETPYLCTRNLQPGKVRTPGKGVTKKDKSMNIAEIINSGANVTLQVTAAQLGEFAKDLIGQTRLQIAREVEASQTEVYYTREQTASLLNVNPSTLWNWDKKGFLKPVRVGGLCRYRKSDINKILNNK